MKLKAVVLPRLRTKLVNGEKVQVLEDRVILVGFRKFAIGGGGALLVIDGKIANLYAVQEIPSYPGSQGFIVTNEWPDDQPSEYVEAQYQVLICEEADKSTCSCAGHLSHGRACKHIGALTSLVKDGNFPDRRAKEKPVEEREYHDDESGMSVEQEYSCKVCGKKFADSQLVFNRMIPPHGLSMDSLICKGSYALPVEPMTELEPLPDPEWAKQ